MTDIEIVAVPLGTFRFAADEPNAGEVGVVIGYVVRHAGGVLLFDTGFGFGDAELDAYYQVRARPVVDALADAGIDPSSIDAVVNCHLHVDHAGQNGRFPGVPIYVQAAEWTVAHTTDHTILDWIDAPGTDYHHIAGDHDLAPGVRIVATPGHTPGHQSLAVATPDRDGRPRRSGGLLAGRMDGRSRRP